MISACCFYHQQIHVCLLKGALCSSGEDIQAQNFNTYNINEVIIRALSISEETSHKATTISLYIVNISVCIPDYFIIHLYFIAYIDILSYLMSTLIFYLHLHL